MSQFALIERKSGIFYFPASSEDKSRFFEHYREKDFYRSGYQEFYQYRGRLQLWQSAHDQACSMGCSGNRVCRTHEFLWKVCPWYLLVDLYIKWDQCKMSLAWVSLLSVRIIYLSKMAAHMMICRYLQVIILKCRRNARGLASMLTVNFI